MSKRKTVITLFLTMLKIGAFTFGGGYAMISLLQNEFVTKRGWLESDEFLDIVAIAESTPGPIAINSATYIGYKKAGVLGSVAATLGVVLPSFTIIFIISLFFDKFLTFTVVANAFKGIQACVVFLILNAGIKMLKSLKKNAFSVTVLSVTVAVMILFSILSVSFSSVFYILIGGAAGFFVYLCSKAKGEVKK